MSKPFALIIEDHADSAVIFAKSAGYEADIARSGDEALQRLAVTTPDVMVLDLQLPRVAGADILRRIRADERLTKCVSENSHKGTKTLRNTIIACFLWCFVPSCDTLIPIFKTGSKTRIIVATAHSQMTEGLAGEADSIFIKPVSFSQLRDLAARLPPGIMLNR